MADNKNGNPATPKTEEPKQDNWFIRGCKFLWRNKWTILSSFAAGGAATGTGIALYNKHKGSKGGGPTPPTNGPTDLL